jgi:hypothetical protein
MIENLKKYYQGQKNRPVLKVKEKISCILTKIGRCLDIFVVWTWFMSLIQVWLQSSLVFVLLHFGHRMTLFYVGVLWKSSLSSRTTQKLRCGYQVSSKLHWVRLAAPKQLPDVSGCFSLSQNATQKISCYTSKT